MGIVIGILALIAIAGFVIWVLRQPVPETTFGRENRARKEAKNARKKQVGSEGDDQANA